MKNVLLVCMAYLCLTAYSSILYANCYSVHAGYDGELKTITGVLIFTSMPCQDDEVCPPCLTPAIMVNDIIFYINQTPEEELAELLNISLYDDWNFPVVAKGYVVERDGGIKIINLNDIALLNDNQNTNDYFPIGKCWTIYDRSGDVDEGVYVTYSVREKIDKDGILYSQIGNYLLRQDGQKVYIVDTYYDSGEFLLYDFSLQVGNTIKNFWGEVATVTERTEIELLDGTKAVLLKYDGRSADLEYVGNLGAGLIGYYESFVFGCYDVSLQCCSVDNNPIYETYEGACDRISEISVVQLNEQSEIVKPIKQFSKNLLQILLPNGRRFDVLGREIK